MYKLITTEKEISPVRNYTYVWVLSKINIFTKEVEILEVNMEFKDCINRIASQITDAKMDSFDGKKMDRMEVYSIIRSLLDKDYYPNWLDNLTKPYTITEKVLGKFNPIIEQ